MMMNSIDTSAFSEAGDGWYVCALMGDDDGESGVGKTSGLDFVSTPFSSIPGDYRFLNSPTDATFRAEGNGCPTLSGGFELKEVQMVRYLGK